MSVTELDYCPLTGDAPAARRLGHFWLVPCGTLPPGTTIGEAERAADAFDAFDWSRNPDGSFVLWAVRREGGR